MIDARAGAHTMEMVHGAYAAHAEGRHVDLPQPDRRHPLARWLAREGRPPPGPAPDDYASWIEWVRTPAARG